MPGGVARVRGEARAEHQEAAARRARVLQRLVLDAHERVRNARVHLLAAHTHTHRHTRAHTTAHT